MCLCEGCHENKHGGRSFKYDDTYSSPPTYPERIDTINKAIKLKKNLAFNYYKWKQKKWMKRKVKPDELTKEIEPKYSSVSTLVHQRGDTRLHFHTEEPQKPENLFLVMTVKQRTTI